MSRLLFFISFLASAIYAQNDTIILSDTLLNSVKILHVDDFNVNYLSIDSNKKELKIISLDSVKGVLYANKKIEVFCDLMSRKKFLGTEEIITINYGDRDSLWIDKKIYTSISTQLKKYNSIVDALNYMGDSGWKTLRSYSTSHNSYTVEHYILKKEIIK